MAQDARNLSSVLLELEQLAMPETPEEQLLVEEILALRFYDVSSVPDAEMAAQRMQPQQCHNNAAAFAARDPSGQSRPVAGWLRRGGLFLFHSVVLSQSRLRCVTPHDHALPLAFAPDPEIEWLDVDDRKIARRRGSAVPYVVRVDPQAIIARARKAKQALLDGSEYVDPAAAWID
ncbi:hypothetical protein [Sphingobium algorifonticola]|uniref:Uncharacterized protein n=1 Tax=Sphingobium algorifonticola TaxID=2008318 RepID=A0A437J5I5_9SPHN|nr:hypothetical protein [Sphingobium algorifonticola]RVT40195.1 hypothetical protein ENE74_12670 [Sphingobium algorifonticola]